MTHNQEIREKLVRFADEIESLVEPYWFAVEQAMQVQEAMRKLVDAFKKGDE